MCLLTLVCLIPNADADAVILLHAQTFAKNLIEMLDTSFSVMESASSLQQTSVHLSAHTQPAQQRPQPSTESLQSVQAAPAAPPQTNPETLKKRRYRDIFETLEIVRRDPYQEKLINKHDMITFYSLADAVTRTDSPISVVTRTYRNTAQFVCIDNELWLNPLKGDYRWVEEVLGQELKLRELQELFEITGSGRTDYSCQEPAILSVEDESARVVKKGILVRC